MLLGGEYLIVVKTLINFHNFQLDFQIGNIAELLELGDKLHSSTDDIPKLVPGGVRDELVLGSEEDIGSALVVESLLILRVNTALDEGEEVTRRGKDNLALDTHIVEELEVASNNNDALESMVLLELLESITSKRVEDEVGRDSLTPILEGNDSVCIFFRYVEAEELFKVANKAIIARLKLFNEGGLATRGRQDYAFDRIAGKVVPDTLEHCAKSTE